MSPQQEIELRTKCLELALSEFHTGEVFSAETAVGDTLRKEDVDVVARASEFYNWIMNTTK